MKLKHLWCLLSLSAVPLFPLASIRAQGLTLNCASNKTIVCDLTAATNSPNFTVLRMLGAHEGDGMKSRGGVIEGRDGALYGTTYEGGSNGFGAIFKLNRDGSGYSVLRSFGTAGTSGRAPFAGLVEGRDGWLFGVNTAGDGGFGNVFKLTKDGSNYTVLHSFTNAALGQISYSGVIEGRDGALFGTTSEGGDAGRGTVFKLNTDGSGYRVLRSFTTNANDGDAPWGAVVEGRDGALYGTTRLGGANGSGTVFKLNRDGSGYTVLHRFTGAGGDGARPYGKLIEGQDGAIYGTTQLGGTGGRGTVFKLNKDGSDYTVLKRFSNAGGDGGQPNSGVIEGRDGALYGTCYDGGSEDRGTIYRLGLDGSGYTVLRSFSTNNFDARRPFAGLIEGSDGALYGGTEAGGANGAGAVFKLELPCSLTFDPPTVVSSCCGGDNVTLAVLSTVTNGACPQVITRTWLATDCCTNTATCSQTVAVVDPRCLPTFTQRPRSMSVLVGSNAVFRVAVSATPAAALQWFKNGVAVPGATEAILAVAAVSVADAGYYHVVASNVTGVATSPTALLRIENVPNTGGDPGGPTDLDFGDLPGPYAACWRYSSYGPYGVSGETCLPIQSTDLKIVSTVPITYPTLLNDNGARHYFLRDHIWLGSQVDGTHDGTPHSRARLDPSFNGSIVDTSVAGLRNEENGIRIVPPPFIGTISIAQSYLDDPRTTPAGQEGNNLFGRVVSNPTLNYRTCYSPGQTVWFTVEAYNADPNLYCDPFYLNVWIDYGDGAGPDGAADGQFQNNAEYVVQDAPLWGADSLQQLGYATGYPYDSSPQSVRELIRDNSGGCPDLLPDIGVQPYADKGLQVFSFTIPPMPNLDQCGKQAFARFRISRKPMAISGANPYGLTDPATGLVNDGGEVEDYPVFITKGCGSGLTGLSTLCLQPTSQASSFSKPALMCLNCPSCEADYGPLPAPELVGFSTAMTGTECEFSVVSLGGWCGTGSGLAPFVGLVANTGSSNLTGVTVTYPISTNAVFYSACSSQGGWVRESNTVVFHLGTLEAGEQAEIALSYLARETGLMNHEFRLTADQPLLNPEDAVVRLPNPVIVGVMPVNRCCTNPAANLVVNGSFEAPVVAPINNFDYFANVPGWTGSAGGGAVDVELWNGVFGGMTALDGRQHLEINASVGNETVEQTVNNLKVGCPVTLCFGYAGRPGYASSFRLDLSGATALSVPLNPPSFTTDGWQTYSTTFTPQSSSLTIQFTGTSGGIDGGAHIDDVCLTSLGLPPGINCPASFDLSIENGSVVVNYPVPTVTGGALQQCAPPSGSMFPLGTTLVTCSATNACGTNTCTFNVTVRRVDCGNGPNRVVNGGFEAPVVANNSSTYIHPIPGWYTTEVTADLELWTGIFGGILSASGNQHLEINAREGDTTVSQTIANVNRDCPMTLCFKYTGRFPNPLNNRFRLAIVGSGLAPVTLNPVAYSVAGWQTYSVTFLPSSSTVTLQFRGLPADRQPGGAHLDDVSLTQDCSQLDADGDGLLDPWELAHRLDPNDPNDAALDSDGDGLSNLREYLAGTDPQDPASVLRLLVVSASPGGDLRLRFEAQADRSYVVEGAPSLDEPWTPVANVPAELAPHPVDVVVPPSSGSSRFFRVRLE